MRTQKQMPCILYVPGNDLGVVIMHAIALFGEHDVMMEISYPMIYAKCHIATRRMKD